MTRMTKSLGGLFFLLVLAVALALPPAAVLAADQYYEIGEVKIGADKPAGWVLEKELVAPKEGLARFEKIYQIRAKNIVNDIFDVNGEKVQVNYSLFAPDVAELAAYKMAAYVKYDTNIVVRDKNVVIEIISMVPWLQLEALSLVKPEPVFGVMIQKDKAPADWKLGRVMVVRQSEVGRFEVKLGAKIELVVNQLFQVGQQVVQVNYVQAASPAEAQKAAKSAREITRGGNVVLTKGSVMIEIIADTPALKAQAAALFTQS